MQHEQIEFLQDKLVQEAAAMIVLAGSETKVEEYEQAIKLVGKAWGSDQSAVDKWLDMIQQERTAVAAEANGMLAHHIMPERDLLLNWTGVECINVMEALFETSVQLSEKDERCALFNIAMTLMECQNLLDWVEKTTSEAPGDSGAASSTPDASEASTEAETSTEDIEQ